MKSLREMNVNACVETVKRLSDQYSNYRVETKKAEPLVVKNELVITPRVNKWRSIGAVPKLHLTPH